MSTTTDTIRHVKSLISEAERNLLKAIKKEALEIVRRYPMVTEYVQAMGSPTFTVVLRGREFTIDVRAGIEEITHNYIWHELGPVERSELNHLHNSMKNLARLHDCWDDYLSGSAAGEALRFGKDGKTITSW